MVNCQSGFLTNYIIGGIIAAALLTYGPELAAGEYRDVAPGKGATIESSQAPQPGDLEVEEPIISGTPFSWEDADKVQHGMTQEEVIAILGEPYSRKESGDDAILVWSYTSTVGGSHAVAYRFSKGRVIANHRVSR
jgi:hypothetical protein